MQKIRKGDDVVVLTGKDKGRKGNVMSVIPKDGKAFVSGINMVKRHTKQSATQEAGIISKEAAIQLSNLAIADPKDGSPHGLDLKQQTMAARFVLQNVLET